ncbi:MAG: sterol desaturase family protein [Chitinophagaceae bacterium]|nr:sterol desaturase family protein [Chitinophagaceae bacterium]
MSMNLLAYAVPLFTGLMLVEMLIARKKGRKIFHFARSVANINVGIAERLLDTVLAGSAFFLYKYLEDRFGIFDIRPSAFLWVLLLLCTDFVWYWYHRLAHEINIFWAAHIVHHQSEDFNYTVSARITVFQAIIRTGFWSILPIIGFPAEMITSILLVHGLYPFFVHTQLVGKLGLLEYILVTPSHHRVHHASNPEYLDKNYGDVFIIWDKLFGTFKKEETPVVYGLTKPLKSHSFLWQHFHYFAELFVAARRQKTFVGKIKILTGKPESLDPDIRDELESRLHIHNNTIAAGEELNRYVVFQVVASLALLFIFILFEFHFSWSVKLLTILFILITLINCGAILEQRRWIFYLEYSRILIVFIGLFLSVPSVALFFLLATIIITLTLRFEKLENRYLSLVYSKNY